MNFQAETESLQRQLEQTQKQAQRLISKLDKMRVGKFSPNVGTDSTLELEVGLDNIRSFNPFNMRNQSNDDYQEMVRPTLFRSDELPDEEEGMGKRMITVEVTGMQSASLRSGRVIITKPQDLEAEGSTLLQAYAERQSDVSALVHTTVSGRLLDTTTGALVLEVYPFVVRTLLTATQGDMSDWVDAVREELAAGVHPAPCGLYARRVSRGVDVASLSGGDVLSTAKALLGVDSSITTSPSTTPTTLQWSLHVQATVVEMIKIKKEVESKVVEETDEAATKKQIHEKTPSTDESKQCKEEAQGRIAKFFKARRLARNML